MREQKRIKTLKELINSIKPKLISICFTFFRYLKNVYTKNISASLAVERAQHFENSLLEIDRGILLINLNERAERRERGGSARRSTDAQKCRRAAAAEIY